MDFTETDKMTSKGDNSYSLALSGEMGPGSTDSQPPSAVPLSYNDVMQQNGNEPNDIAISSQAESVKTASDVSDALVMWSQYKGRAQNNNFAKLRQSGFGEVWFAEKIVKKKDLQAARISDRAPVTFFFRTSIVELPIEWATVCPSFARLSATDRLMTKVYWHFDWEQTATDICRCAIWVSERPDDGFKNWAYVEYDVDKNTVHPPVIYNGSSWYSNVDAA